MQGRSLPSFVPYHGILLELLDVLHSVGQAVVMIVGREEDGAAGALLGSDVQRHVEGRIVGQLVVHDLLDLVIERLTLRAVRGGGGLVHQIHDLRVVILGLVEVVVRGDHGTDAVAQRAQSAGGDDEVLIVDPETPITREEYEKKN